MPKKIITKLNLMEISSVDDPAHKGALAVITKNDGQFFENILKYWGENDGKAHSFKDVLVDQENTKRMWEARDKLYPMIDAISTSISSITSDKNLDLGQKKAKVKESIEDFLASAMEILPDIEEELSEAIQKFAAFVGDKAGSSGNYETDDKGATAMSDDAKKTLEELQKKLEETTKSLEQAQAELKVEKSLSDADREFLKGLDDKAKAEFLALDVTKRAERISKARSNDETLEVDGQIIRKSVVGDSQFALFKSLTDRQKAQEEALLKANEEALTEKLTKRAETEMTGLPGKVEDKVSLLKAVRKLDQKSQDHFDQIVKYAHRASTLLTKSEGVSMSDTLDETLEGGSVSAEKALEAKAEELRKADPKLTKAAAMAKAVEANPKLYDQMSKVSRD